MLNDIEFEQLVIAAVEEAGTRNYWTPEEKRFLQENIHRLTLEEIAAAIGRSVNAVKVMQIRSRVPAKSRAPGYLTANQAANALGMDWHTINYLASLGLIRFERLPGRRGIRRISELRLRLWAIKPGNWVYFKAARMQDPHLRRLVDLAQARWGDKWLPIGEAERMLGVGQNTLNQRIHRCGFRPWEIVDWGNWWIRRSAIERLVIRPCRTIPEGINWHSPRADDFLRRIAGSGLSAAAIGRMMKWSDYRVARRMAQLGVREAAPYIEKINNHWRKPWKK